MSDTGIASLDHAPDVLRHWLDVICDDLGWSDQRRAYLLLRETLHGLRDMMGVDEAAAFGAQLPILVRGVFFEGWNPTFPSAPSAPVLDLDTKQRDAAERAVAAVMALLLQHLRTGVIAQTRSEPRRPMPTVGA